MAARKRNTAAATETATSQVDKAGNFKRLAGKRVPKAIAAIRSVSKLASKASYEYTDEQAEKVVSALEAEVAALRQQFDAGEVAKDGITFEV